MFGTYGVNLHVLYKTFRYFIVYKYCLINSHHFKKILTRCLWEIPRHIPFNNKSAQAHILLFYVKRYFIWCKSLLKSLTPHIFFGNFSEYSLAHLFHVSVVNKCVIVFYMYQKRRPVKPQDKHATDHSALRKMKIKLTAIKTNRLDGDVLGTVRHEMQGILAVTLQCYILTVSLF